MITIIGNKTEIEVFKELARKKMLNESIECTTFYSNSQQLTDVKLLGIEIAFKEDKEQ